MPGMPGLLNNIVSNVINKLKKKKISGKGAVGFTL